MVDENVLRLFYYNIPTVLIKTNTIVNITKLRHYFICLINNFFYALNVIYLLIC